MKEMKRSRAYRRVKAHKAKKMAKAILALDEYGKAKPYSCFCGGHLKKNYEMAISERRSELDYIEEVKDISES